MPIFFYSKSLLRMRPYVVNKNIMLCFYLDTLINMMLNYGFYAKVLIRMRLDSECQTILQSNGVVIYFNAYSLHMGGSWQWSEHKGETMK